ncbi:aminotransferase class III-fold pyridoxal phosphate-dependent enzyme [Thalassotalea sp. Y01]|uniref:aminotransferase class III-fold pyridoxal phosphate-dependent enzyme n=1 Tax=Thalassotalea sp. Y01 TaxID=2729613 RepID=UPI0020071884|nr:aminotransferase class III-fold pyridoxal phosphate-dependent enzyme [Thalassotalea sp. Y01]
MNPKLNFASRAFDIDADMMTFAKALSSSYLPISAASVSANIHETIREPASKVGAFAHGYTYSGHPVCAAVALKTLQIYERDQLFIHAGQLGCYFQQRLNELIKFECVGEIRGMGLIAGLEIVSDKANKTACAELAANIAARCLENGLILRQVYGNTLALCPPLIINKSQADEIVDKLTLSIEQTLIHR